MLNAQKERSSLVFFLFLVAYGIIIINLLSIQILHHGFYTQLGSKQYTTTVEASPPRGMIVDRHGKPLAFNAESFAAFIVPNKLQYPSETKEFIATHYPECVNRLEASEEKPFMFVRRKLTQDEQATINALPKSDIGILTEKSRYYPHKSLASIVGITNIDNRGQFGLEALYDKHLTGQPSKYTVKQDARSGRYYFDKVTKSNGVESKPVKTTIDSDLQFLVNEELCDRMAKYNAEEGHAIILDPRNGDIIALAHAPCFDPNDTAHLSIAATKNRCLTETYEFGSVLKIFSALAALEEGVTDLDEMIDCGGGREGTVNGFKFTTVIPLGVVPFREAFTKSNNFGMAQVVSRLGTKMYDHYRNLGFGSRTKIKWPAEQAGYITPPDKWSKRSIISLSFGYEIRVNIVQLARALSVLCNGGRIIEPRLILDDQKPQLSEQLYRQETIDKLRDMLSETVNSGTARYARIKGYDVRGKTGTANLVVNGKYSDKHNIFTFCGIVEKGDYSRIIVVSIKASPEKRVYAATVTAPLFEAIAQKMLIHDKVV